jgi:hypothetical protein
MNRISRDHADTAIDLSQQVVFYDGGLLGPSVAPISGKYTLWECEIKKTGLLAKLVRLLGNRDGGGERMSK